MLAGFVDLLFEDRLLEGVEHELQTGQHEVVFALVVVVDERGALPEALADALDRQLRVAVLDERPVGRREDLLFGPLGIGEDVLGHGITRVPADEPALGPDVGSCVGWTYPNWRPPTHKPID